MKFNNYIFLLTCFFIKTIYAQQIKDTLYFKYDKQTIILGKHEKDHFYPKLSLEDLGSSETFFFDRDTVNFNLKPKIILDLNNYILNSKFYKPNKVKNKIDDFELANHLGHYTVFIIIDSPCGKQKFIKVSPYTEIE